MVDEVFIQAQVRAAPAAVDAITDEATGANVIIVCSGWGDGIYPTFIGYAADGGLTSFVTDFLVVPDQTADRRLLAAMRQGGGGQEGVRVEQGSPGLA
ncbi:DUF4241 domain-containing protein [Micromonospora sp. NPDC047074]|uniref:DUF4241 domain-containing protein n=1 Tax=Micromonospora sp. NPDC047074 TaxID=3154339 RepID=UPI003408C704